MSLGGKYVFATVMCLVLIMSSFISVGSPSHCVCSLSVRMVMLWGILGVLAFCVNFVSCIVMMSGWVLCTRLLVPRFSF